MSSFFKCQCSPLIHLKRMNQQESTFRCRGHRSDPRSGKIPYGMGQPSLCAATAEKPMSPREDPMCCNKTLQPNKEIKRVTQCPLSILEFHFSWTINGARQSFHETTVDDSLIHSPQHLFVP